MTKPTISTRIELVEAKLALRELADAYCQRVDARDWDRLGSLFTRDGRFNDVDGREAIIRHFAESAAAYAFSFHYVQRIELETLGADHAAALVVGHAEIQVGDELVLVGPRYNDTYAIEEDAWRISSRRVAYAYRLRYDEYGRRRGVAESPDRTAGAE